MISNPPKASPGALSSEVVLKTRTGKIKTTEETLSACNSDMFDSFLRGDWKPALDKKGRRKLRLDFDDKVFRQTLLAMHTGESTVPSTSSSAEMKEHQRQLHFLCHRPTLEAEAAAFDAEQAAATAAAAAAAEAAKRIPAGFVRIEAGEFTMGSPENEAGRSNNESPRRVELTRAFWYQSTPVTQGQWQSLMGSNPSRFQVDGPDNELASERPVEMVNWYEAAAYCNALSVKDGLSPYYALTGFSGTPGTGSWVNPSRVSTLASGANSYRLPSEAEQQRACRGSEASTAANATYAPPGTGLSDIAWHSANAGDSTHPVGRLLPTNEGVHDALGNVWEWGNDWYDEHLAAVGANGKLTDPVGPDAGAARVSSGGSWHSPVRRMRAAHRSSGDPTARYGILGFRPARFVPLDP